MLGPCKELIDLIKPAQLTPDHSTTTGLSIVVGEAADAAVLNVYIYNIANGFSLFGVTYVHTFTCTQRIIASNLLTVYRH